MPSPLRALLGERIRHLRKRRGLSQERFAELTGRSVKTISNIEGGRAGAPIETFYLFSEKLGVDLKDLFEGVGPRSRINPTRAKLLADLLDTARRLDDERLRIALQQLQALLPPEPS